MARYLWSMKFRKSGFLEKNNEISLKMASEFALNFGIAFQIRDDIRDYFSQEATGKVFANDIKEKNRYGTTRYFFDGKEVREKNRYGTVKYYFADNEIREKSKSGTVIYYFDGKLSKEQIYAVISII